MADPARSVSLPLIPPDLPSGTLQCSPPQIFAGSETDAPSLQKLEASGVALCHDHLLVVDDKTNDLFVFDKEFHFIRKIDGSVFGPLRKFEDIAVDGEWITVVGDHDNKKIGDKEVEDHSIGFRFHLSGKSPQEWNVTDVQPFQFAWEPRLGWSPVPGENRVKVEGLAVYQGMLYVGVRRSAADDRSVQIFRSTTPFREGTRTVSLQPILPLIPTGVLPSDPDRPLQLSSLHITPQGDLFMLLSAQADSKWPHSNTTRNERFMGNRLLYWNLSWSPCQRRPLVVADFAPGSKVEGIAVVSKPDDANHRSLALVYDNDPAVSPFPPSEWSLCTLSWPLK